MNGWRGRWASAQISASVVSSLVWIAIWGLSVPALALMLAGCVAAVVGRNTRPMLWWRYGATPTTDGQRGAILAAIVPIPSLRGRNQPTTWIGRRLASGHVVMPARSHLVVSPEFVRQVINGELSDRQASAMVSQALGHNQVNDLVQIIAVDAYCLPWRFVEILTGVVSQVARQSPIIGFSWKIRWIVFGAAAVDAYRNARWAALFGVVLVGLLSWSTGHFEGKWRRALQDLGDQRALSEGLGPDLADLIQRSDSSLAARERADRLRTGVPDARPGGGGPPPWQGRPTNSARRPT